MIALHGGEIEWAVSERFGIPIQSIVSFASTVSPLMPERVGALKKRFKQLYLYPPRDPRELKRAIAQYEGLKGPDSIILGSGSTELIHLFAQVFCKGEAVIPVPTYSEYEIAVARYGKSIFIPTGDDFNLDVPLVQGALTKSTKAIIVCNPCNPTGRLHAENDLLELAKIARELNIVLCVDEAYSAFSPSSKKYSMIPYVDTYPIVVIKSLSKLFGVPSFRVGWGIGSKTIIDSLNEFKIPGTMGNLDIWAAEELIKDNLYQESVIKLIDQQRQEVSRQLSEIPSLTVFPTDTNFLLVKITSEEFTSTEVFDTLARRGLVIRDCASIRGLGNQFFRVTIRQLKDNLKLIASLREIFADQINAVVSIKSKKRGQIESSGS